MERDKERRTEGDKKRESESVCVRVVSYRSFCVFRCVLQCGSVLQSVLVLVAVYIAVC